MKTTGRPRRPSWSKPRLLIVGCGDVGSRIVSRARSRFRIFAVTASGSRAAALREQGAVPLAANLDRRETLARLAGLAPYVVHLAPPPPTGTRDARTARLVAALAPRATGARAFVYVSTTGVYGDRGGARIDETATPAPATARAQRRVDAERRLRRGPWHATVLRAPGIYAGDRLPLERLSQRIPVARHDEDVYTNHIHADDLARLCLAALFRGRRGRVYHAADDSELKVGDFLDQVADARGLPRPPRVSRAELRAAVSPVMWTFLSESRRLSNRRLRRELRFVLRYPTVGEALQRPAM
ncbi:MAG TPA: NAD(P)H-binding protein [Burkholderiaceae bacterium]|nr:NAD(P)H-binding protein [Burkholderiaceae bacterium]